MEVLVNLLTILKDFSPLGVAALAVIGLILMIWKNPFKGIEKRLDTITGNHLHDMPRIADSIDKTVETLQRIEVKISENFAVIREKLDGQEK